MTILFENPDRIDGPASHVFIVGIDDYPWIDKINPDYAKTLSTGCRSAVAFYDWITGRYTNRSAPLGSVRVLLSPCKGRKLDSVASKAAAATASNFLEDCSDWATALSKNRDNVGIFLFVGHGMGLGFDRRVLALHDFGRHEIAPFQGSVSLDNIYAGMAPSDRWPEVARTQFYFVDAGASLVAIPDYLERNTSHIFAVPFSTIADDRAAPLFFSAAAGGHSYALQGGVTFFVEALLECLEGDGAEPARARGESQRADWVVTGLSLSRAMQAKAQALSSRHEVNISFATSGLIGDAVLQEIEGVPLVPVTILVGAHDGGQRRVLEITSGEGQEVISSNAVGETAAEFEKELRAGVYQAILRPADPAEPVTAKLFLVHPPQAIVSL